MTLIDTSVWVHLIRGTADRELVSQVEALLQVDETAWCPMIRVELWAGERNSRHREQLTTFDQTLPSLPIEAPVWNEAVRLTREARANGVAAPPSDFVILACARFHRTNRLHRDKHFDLLAAL